MAVGWYGCRQVVASLALAKAQSPQIRSSTVGTRATLPRFYGYGMSMQPTTGGMMHLTHSGAFSAGADTAHLMVPEQQPGIVVLSNALAGVLEAKGSRQVLAGPDKAVVPLRPWDGGSFVGTLANGGVPTDFPVAFAGGRRITGLTMELGPSQDGVLTRVVR